MSDQTEPVEPTKPPRTGRSAWSVNFKLIGKPRMGSLPPDSTDAQQELNWAIRSIQVELSVQGFNAHGHATTGVFGEALRDDVKDFQKAKGLAADGIIGPITGRALFSEAAARIGAGLPKGILCGLLFAESNFDPYAEGYLNPIDKGITQINLDAPPESRTVTREQAFTADWAIGFCAETTKLRHDGYVTDYGTDDDVAWDAAAAAWHNPSKGKTWAITGLAPDTKIKDYVDKVRGACT